MEIQIPIEELLYEEEGTTLDFKREQYPFSSANDHQKSELLKDILAFSNAWRRSDAYILVGVEEVKGGRSRPVGIETELDDAQLQQFVSGKTKRPVNFTYSTVLVDGIKIGVIRIPVQTRPVYLERDYGKLKRHVVYIRRGSSTDEANPDEVHDMGRADIKEAQEIPELSFEFADLNSRSSFGTELNLELVILDIPNIKEVPDYYEYTSVSGPLGISIPSLNHSNSSYYRDLVKYYFVKCKSAKLAFCLKNDSSKAISDIRAEIFVSKNNAYHFFESSDFPSWPRSHYDPLSHVRFPKQIITEHKRVTEIQDLGDTFRIEVPFEKAQPKQTVFCNEAIFIAAKDNFTLDAAVTIYADNIPVPIEKKISISCSIKNQSGSLEDIEELHRTYLQN